LLLVALAALRNFKQDFKRQAAQSPLEAMRTLTYSDGEHY
jgi:hypothetical protein